MSNPGSTRPNRDRDVTREVMVVLFDEGRSVCVRTCVCVDVYSTHVCTRVYMWRGRPRPRGSEEGTNPEMKVRTEWVEGWRSGWGLVVEVLCGGH